MTDLVFESLQQVLARGVQREVGGNTPFLLEGTSRVWCVRSGSVEVFLVRAGDGDHQGVRTHFMSAAEGEWLFGMDLAASGEGLGLLAVGVVGTQVIELTLSDVRGLAAVPSQRPAVVERVDAWVSALSAGVSRPIYPKPRADVLVEPGTAATLADGQRARARKGVAWLRHRQGRSLLVGMEEVEAGESPPLVPVSPETWVQTLGAAEIDVVETATALADGSIWPALESFYGLVFKCASFNTTLTAVDEYNRLTRKAARDRQSRHESLSEIAGILGHAPAGPPAGPASDDPLFLACAAIGQVMGVEFQPPPKSKEENRVVDPLIEIAKASRLRTRPVALVGPWWMADHGPLLAYRAGTLTPVALRPLSSSRYELFDPLTRTSTPVTAEVAGGLAPAAVMFYAPFGESVLTGARLLRFGLRKSQSDVWRLALMALTAGVLGMVTPLAVGAIFDTVVPEAERGELLQLGLGLFVCACAAALFQLTQALALLRVEGRLDSSINAAVMDRLLSLPTAFFRQFSSGDLGLRTYGLSNMRQVLSGAVVGTVFTAVSSVFSVALLFYYDWRLALIAMSVTLVLVVVTAVVAREQLVRQRELLRVQGRLYGLVLEILTGISKLRVAGVEGYAFASWARAFGDQKRMTYEGRTGMNLLVALHTVLPVLSLMLLFAWMAFFGGTTALSTGRFLAFNAAFTQFLMAAIGLSVSTMLVINTVPLYERVRPILDAVPEVDRDKLFPGDLSGDIEASHVSFRYDATGPLVLKDVSFRAGPGEFIAFVGPSGSGKSTLVRLLLGFERPERGSVQYDGQDLSVLDIAAVRRQLGVVLQHSKVMAGDILRNIVGTSLLTLDDAWEAARQVGIDEDIRQMPMGMHTVISDGGGTFSGGQRQRLLIARAIAQGPRMLFFDEATSALDNRTQAIVSESLERLQATRLVIAHRLSTVIHADRIYVLVAGQIVQTGTYDELMAQDGVFKDLVQRQLA